MNRRSLLALAAMALVFASLLAAPAVPANAALINPCVISPDLCGTVEIKALGNGTGVIETTNVLGGVADGNLDCLRTGGVQEETCSHTFFLGGAKSKVIYFADLPEAGTQVCGNNICKTTPLFWQYTLTPTGLIVSHTFSLLDPVKLHVRVDGGLGEITSDPAGIQCGNICGVDFARNHSVAITIRPALNQVFRGWSVGPCHGQGFTCTFTITAETTVTAALFDNTPTPLPTLPPPPTPIATPKPTAKPTPKPTQTPTAAPTSTAAIATAPSGTTAPVETSAGSSPTVEPASSPVTGPAVTGAPATAPTSAGSSGGPVATGDGQQTPTSGSDSGGPLWLLLIVIAIVVAGIFVLGARRRRTR